MKTKHIIILLLISCLSLYLLCYPTYFIFQSFKRINLQKPLVIAHGGAKQLNPENTIKAFEEAYQLGVDAFEIDIRMTKDEIPITHHNETIDTTSNGTGKVADYTYKQLTNYNFGYYFKDLNGQYPYHYLKKKEYKKERLMPITLEKLFQKYGKDMLYIIEIKDNDLLGKKAVDKVLSLIREYRLESQTCLASFHDDVIRYAGYFCKDEICYSMDMAQSRTLLKESCDDIDQYTDKIDGFQIPVYFEDVCFLDKKIIDTIHDNNLFVIFWTVNDKKDMLLCIQQHVDGIITDRPDILISLLEE